MAVVDLFGFRIVSLENEESEEDLIHSRNGCVFEGMIHGPSGEM